MQKLCAYDGKPFEAKRKSAKYCSPAHRLKALREKGEEFDPTTAGVKTVDIKPIGVNIVHSEGFELTTDKAFSSPGLTKALDELDELDAEILKIQQKAEKLGITVKEYKRRLAAFQKMGLSKVEWLSTGIEDFDELTKIPRGRITQIQGPYGVGKTTLCLNMIAGMKDAKILYIDSEASLNPELIMDLGISDKNFTLYNESAFLEDIAEVIQEAAKNGKYDVIVFDSLAACTTRTIAESAFAASNIGQKAKLTHKLITLVQMPLKNTDTALVVINQEREVVGSYVSQKYTPGGMAVPYAASLMVALKTIKSWRFPQKPKDGLYLGHEVEATIIKSKVNQPWRTKKFKLLYPNPVAQDDETVGTF